MAPLESERNLDAAGVPGDWMEPPPRPSPVGRARRGWTAAIALVCVVAVIALVITFAYMRRRAATESPDLLALAAARATSASVAMGTADVDSAHQFILDQFGWPLQVPELESATLVGVGVDPLVAGVELPFLRYRTAEGAPVTVYAFDYAFLDAATRQVTLAPAVYARLSSDNAMDTRRQDDRYVIVWRRRAAIYAAVTDNADAAGALSDEVRLDERPASGG